MRLDPYQRFIKAEQFKWKVYIAKGHTNYLECLKENIEKLSPYYFKYLDKDPEIAKMLQSLIYTLAEGVKSEKSRFHSQCQAASGVVGTDRESDQISF